MPEILAGMREVASPVEGRMRLEGGGYVAVIAREWTGQEKSWLLTAFELRRKGESGPDSPSGLRPAADVQPSLSRYYGEEAGPKENVGSTRPDVETAWRGRSDVAGQRLREKFIVEAKADIGSALDGAPLDDKLRAQVAHRDLRTPQALRKMLSRPTHNA